MKRIIIGLATCLALASPAVASASSVNQRVENVLEQNGYSFASADCFHMSGVKWSCDLTLATRSGGMCSGTAVARVYPKGVQVRLWSSC